MLNSLIKFAECCRAWDLRVSTIEVMDCAAQLNLVPIRGENDFKTVLRANFAKSRREQKKFDQVYHLYFHERPIPLDHDREAVSGEIVKEGIEKLLEEFVNPENMTEAQHGFARMIQGEPAAFLDHVQRLQSAEEKRQKAIKSNLAQLSGKLSLMLAISQMTDRFIDQVKRTETDPALRRQLIDHLSDRAQHARSLISREPDYYTDMLVETGDTQSGQTDLATQPLSTMDPHLMDDMKEMIARLVRKLKDQMARRYAVKNRGSIDVKQTLRRSAKFQGVPIDIRYKAREKTRAKIVTLCDISGSVWTASKFMLHFLYSLQDCFSRVRSFVFVSDLVEITDLLETPQVSGALDRVMSNPGINTHARTDYGMAFQQFKHQALRELDKKTTVIILGDARSNYQNPQAGILSQIREKVRRMIWLNPEPQHTWYTGDSEIRQYRKHCHELCACSNLSQLEDFIRRLVL